MDKIVLNIVPEPPPLSISIIRAQSGYKGSFFIGRGKGEVDYVCGSCNQNIAKSVWYDSIRDIVVQCFHCQSYNQFPSYPKSSFTERILLTTGSFNFSGPVHVDFGKLVEGKVPPKHEMKANNIDTLLNRTDEKNAITRDEICKIISANEGVTRGIDLSKRNLAAIDLSGLDLRSIDFSGSSFRSGSGSSVGAPAKLDNANLEGCNLEGTNFAGASMKSANLSGTKASLTDFSSTDMTEANFFNSILDEAKFIYANLSKTEFNLASLNGAYFRDAELRTASFTGVKWGEKYILGDERESYVWGEQTYKSLKMWHRSSFMEDIAGEFRYRELWSRKKRHNDLLRASLRNHSPRATVITLSTVIPLTLADILFGYGERWKRIVLWWFIIVAIFAAAYFSWAITGHSAFSGQTTGEHALNSIYYSIASLSALGYGNWVSDPIGWVKYAGLIEAILGPILIALLITTFARVWSR